MSIMLAHRPLISKFLKVGAHWSTIFQKKTRTLEKRKKAVGLLRIAIFRVPFIIKKKPIRKRSSLHLQLIRGNGREGEVNRTEGIGRVLTKVHLLCRPRRKSMPRESYCRKTLGQDSSEISQKRNRNIVMEVTRVFH